jgi:hypothetical protein
MLDVERDSAVARTQGIVITEEPFPNRDQLNAPVPLQRHAQVFASVQRPFRDDEIGRAVAGMRRARCRDGFCGQCAA